MACKYASNSRLSRTYHSFYPVYRLICHALQTDQLPSLSLSNKLDNMKKYTIAIMCILLLFIGLQSCKKDKLAPKGITESWDITSANTGTTYTMTVFYPDKQFPSTPVPVVYVLDGFWWKDMTGEVISDLSGSGKIPKCLMVSIDYKKGDGAYARGTDLTLSRRWA
jgi:hypothetical protein